MRRIAVVASMLMAATGCGSLTTGEQALEAEDAGPFLVGPIVQSPTESSVGLMWEVDKGEQTIVDYGTTPALGQTVEGIVEPSVGSRTLHHATLTGLAPDTRYYYRARSGAIESRIFEVRTPPAKGHVRPFKFAVYSDCQQQPSMHRQIVDQGIFGTVMSGAKGDVSDELAFVLVAGDVVQDGGDYSQFKQRLFDPIRNLSAQVPFYVAIGNHENDAPVLWKYLDMPRNGTPGFEEHWYSFDYANAHVIGLDTNPTYQIPTQLDWLDQDLARVCADDDTDMVFAFFHHPYKSELWLPGEEAYSGEVVQRLERTLDGCGKKGAYFFGHTHGYSRGQSKDSSLYWVNVGSAGGHLDRWDEQPQRDYPEYQRSFDEYGVVVVDVNADGRRGFTARRHTFGDDQMAKTGEVQDEFGATMQSRRPETPHVAAATAQRQGAKLVAELKATPFVAAAGAGGGRHLESEWQIGDAAAGFAGPTAGAWLRFENWYHDEDTNAGLDITQASIDLPDGAESWSARVRYRDAGLDWSAWSAPVRLGSTPPPPQTAQVQ
jgi:hypothetical protein